MSKRKATPATWMELYGSVPPKSQYRKLLSLAHGFGHDEGSNEARVELLFALRNAIANGANPVDEINRKLDKLRRNGRMPEGFDQDEE